MATTTGFAVEGVIIAVERAFELPHAVRRSAQAVSDATTMSRRTWANMLNGVRPNGYESAERFVWIGHRAAAQACTVTTRHIRVGVQIAQQHSHYEKIRDTAAELEDLGVDILFNWDHFFPLSGAPDGLHFESWTMLAALQRLLGR